MNKPAKLFINKCGSFRSALNVSAELAEMYSNILSMLSNVNELKIADYTSKASYYSYLNSYYKSKIK